MTADRHQVIDVIGNFNFSESVRLRFGVFNVFDELYARWINISNLDAEARSAIENAHEPGMSFRIGLHIDI